MLQSVQSVVVWMDCMPNTTCAVLASLLLASSGVGVVGSDIKTSHYLRACAPCASCVLAQRDCCTAAARSTTQRSTKHNTAGCTSGKGNPPRRR